MRTIRVGFVLSQAEWLGGINYFRNLFMAINLLPSTKIEPVIFTGLRADVSPFEGLAEIVRAPLLDRYDLSWCARQVLAHVFPRRDYPLYFLLRRHQIDLMFHTGRFWKGCSLPNLGWIPDFQHLHFPQFFDWKECKLRNDLFIGIVHHSTALLLSSQDALKDLNRFSPGDATPAHVLRFVSSLGLHQTEQQSRAELVVRYQLDRPWFHIPNQFWAHKNHGAVIEALRVLKADGFRPLVIATGKTSDSRNSRYFPSLMNRVVDYDLRDEFRVLGVLPYADVAALMRYSIAVINPSLFEGWSTTVEESKSMGKAVILSDIAVHREQNPERGYYFDPNDPNALAGQMKALTHAFDEASEAFHYTKARNDHEVKRRDFAMEFESICLKVTHTDRVT